MAGIISGLRWCFFNTGPPSLYYLVGLLPVMILLFSGLDYFRRMETRMADEL